MAASAALTGTAVGGIAEAAIVAGGRTIIITLTDDTFVADDGTFAAARQAIIDGCDSAQAEATGWDAEVKAKLAVTTVVRTSDVICTITLSAQAAYNITAPEVITVTVPAAALVGNAPLVASPTVTIAINAATCALTGTATASITENDIITGGKTLILTLTGDTFVAAGGTFDAVRQGIIDGIDSAQSATYGWDAEVKAKEAVTAVVRTSATQVTVTLTAAAAYGIPATETITVTIPAAAVLGAVAIVAAPTFTVAAITPSVALTGTVTNGTMQESCYVAGGKTVVLTLTGDTFVPAGATFNATRAAIIAGMDSDGAEAAGWDAEIKDKEVVTAVVRTSARVVTITLSAAASYDITLPETVTVTVPAAALTGGVPLVAPETFTIDRSVASVLGFGNRSW